MHNLIRMYNQNRIKIWIIVIGIIIAITLVQIINNAVKENNIEKNRNLIAQEQEKYNNQKYTNESKSMVSGGVVSESKQNTYGNLIDEFFTYCINKEPEKAYDLLSSDCKKVLYPSEKIFETLYYNEKFNGNKKYSFQSWSSNSEYIYLVKIYDNMLATGKDNTSNYLQDYVTIVDEGNSNYKISISSFIEIEPIEKSVSKDGISILIKESYVYMDYQVFNIEVSNTTNNTISLVDYSNNKSLCATDINGIEYNALLNENTEEDFIISSQKKKNIKIKFSNSYRVGNGIQKIKFSNIIKDYNTYLNNKESYNGIINIEF